MEIHIEVPGEPVAWQRPGQSKGRRFTPKETREWKRKAAIAAKVARNGTSIYKPLALPFSVEIVAAFKVPESWPKWKKELAHNGSINHTTKPDEDNISKIVKDALNGIIWHDDCQVVECFTRKRYGDIPGVWITINDMRGYTAQIKRRPK